MSRQWNPVSILPKNCILVGGYIFNVTPCCNSWWLLWWGPGSHGATVSCSSVSLGLNTFLPWGSVCLVGLNILGALLLSDYSMILAKNVETMNASKLRINYSSWRGCFGSMDTFMASFQRYELPHAASNNFSQVRSFDTTNI